MDNKVIFIEPNHYYPLRIKHPKASPPLGLAYMAAVIEREGASVEIIDATVLGLTPEEAARKAMEKKPSIVGVSAMTHICNYAASVARSLPPSVLKVTGGPHPSGIPEDLLCRGFDVAVRGEGEITMLDLARGKPLEKIPGISFMRNGGIVHNPPRKPLDPDILPQPARHLLANFGTNRPYFLTGTRYFPWAPLFTTRGCPYNCYYCNKQVYGRRFSRRSVESVTDEILMLVNEHGVRELAVYDDCFNADPEWAGKILDFIIGGKLNIKLRFPNGLRIENIDEVFIGKLASAGCIHVDYGIESGDEVILKRIPKNYTPEIIRHTVLITRKAGIFTCGLFILGLLGDTEETMEKTIDFARELDLDAAFFSILTPYPGTRLWKMVQERGKLLTSSWESFRHAQNKVIFTLPEAPPPEVTEAMYTRAHRRFYFSPRYVLRQIRMTVTSFSRLRMTVQGILYLLKINRPLPIPRVQKNKDEEQRA